MKLNNIHAHVEWSVFNTIDVYAKDESYRRYRAAKTISDEDYAALVTRERTVPKFSRERVAAKISRWRADNALASVSRATRLSGEDVAAMVLTDWARHSGERESARLAARTPAEVEDERESDEFQAEVWRSLGWKRDVDHGGRPNAKK